MAAITRPIIFNVRLAFFLFLSCINCLQAYSQENLPKFGSVDVADLLLKECPFDKSADAMDLIKYEDAELTFTLNGYYLDIERWVRIKIFSKTGFEHATVDIPYMGSGRGTRITDISAKTYNIDEKGNVETVNVERKDIFKEKTGYGESAVRFAFPGVKVGSVVELKYVERKENIFYLAPWMLQDLIPARLSVCKLDYPKETRIDMRILGNLPINVKADTSSRGEVSFKCLASNVPAFRFEPMMTSIKDNLQRIEFAITPLASSYTAYFLPRDSDTAYLKHKWAYFNSRLLHSLDFGVQMAKDLPGIGGELNRIKKMAKNEEKLSAVYDWVINTVKWNNDDGDYSEADVLAAWKNKTGSKTDINMLIINLLLKAGVQAFPLIVSTRENGRTDNNFPDFGQFNGTDVFVLDSNSYYILDGTQLRQSYKIPPYNILNRYAFLVASENSKWLFISDPRPLMKNFISVRADIDSGGIMTGEVRIAYYDYAKAEVLRASKEEDKEESKDLLQTDVVDLKIDSVKEDGADDAGKPFTRSFKFTLEMQQTGDFYFLDPFFLSPFRKNPFIDTGRRSAIDFGCNQYYSINMYIGLPGNIGASDLPPNKEIRLADSSFSFGRFIASQGNAIVVRNHFEILNPVFAAEDYPFVKQVFEKMYALLNERIVIKKSN